MAENVEITAKLKLDTTEAEAKMKALDSGKDKTAKVTLPKDAKIELPKDATKGLKDLFTGPSGLKNIGKIARGAMGGVRGLGNSLMGVASSVPKVAGLITLIVAIISLIIKLVSGTDSFKAIADSFKEMLELIKILLAPVVAYTAEITLLLQGLVNQLKPLFELAANLLKVVLTPVLYTLKMIAVPLKLILALLSPVLELLNQVASLIADGLDTALASLVEMLDELIEPVMKFTKLISAVIKEVFGWIREVLGIGGKSLYSTTGTETASLKTSLDTWETANEGVTKGDEEIVEGLDKATGVIEGIKKFLEPILNIVKSVIQFIWSSIKSIFDVIKKIFEPILVVVKTVLEFIKPIIKVIGTVIGWISENLLKPLLDFVMKGISFIVDFFKNLVSSVAAAISNVFKGGQGEGFGGGLFNETGRWGDGYQPGDIIGSAWDLITGLVGKGWLWKDGGTLNVGAQVWGMNEKGNPEFLFNAGGHDTVINKDILSDAMYQAIVRAQGTSASQRLEVSVREGTPAGPRELAQWLLPSLKFALK